MANKVHSRVDNQYSIDILSMDNITSYFWYLFAIEFKYLNSYDNKRRCKIARRHVLDYMLIKHAARKEEILFALEELLIPSELSIGYLSYDKKENKLYHPKGFCVCVL